MPASGRSDHRRHADDEQLTQIAVAHLGGPAEADLAAARVLARHQTEPGREMATGAEQRGVRD